MSEGRSPLRVVTKSHEPSSRCLVRSAAEPAELQAEGIGRLHLLKQPGNPKDFPFNLGLAVFRLPLSFRTSFFGWVSIAFMILRLKVLLFRGVQKSVKWCPAAMVCGRSGSASTPLVQYASSLRGQEEGRQTH